MTEGAFANHQSSDSDSKGIYLSRSISLEIIEHNAEVYSKHRKKEAAWRRGQKVMAVAPLVAAATIMAMSKADNIEEKMLVNVGALYASASLVIAGLARREKYTKRAYEIAVATAPVCDGLDIPRAKWVEEGLAVGENLSNIEQGHKAGNTP